MQWHYTAIQKINLQANLLDKFMDCLFTNRRLVWPPKSVGTPPLWTLQRPLFQDKMSKKGHKIPPFWSVSTCYSDYSTGSPIVVRVIAAGWVLVRGEKKGGVYIGICFREHGKIWGRDIWRNYQLCGAKASGRENNMDLVWWCHLLVHGHGNTCNKLPWVPFIY